MAAAGFLATIPVAFHLPSGIQTVGDLVRRIATDNRSALFARQHGWDCRDIWDTLVDVIARQLDVDPALVTPSARLVDDLGLC